MFNVGDLVRFKASGIVRSRYNPNKKFGIVTRVERDLFESYNGKREDMIEVLWMPWNVKERMMEFYLEPLKSEA